MFGTFKSLQTNNAPKLSLPRIHQAFGFEANCLGNSAEGMHFSSCCRRIASAVMKHYLHGPGLAKLWKAMNHELFSEVDKKIYSCIARRRKERASRGEPEQAAASGYLSVDFSNKK